jgi:phosphatidylglycerophosphate synthase
MNYIEFKNIAVPEKKYNKERNKHSLYLFYVKYFLIEPAVPISFLLNKVNATADFVSVLRVPMCFIAIPFFSFGYFWSYFGLFILFLAQITDHVDGQLARVQKTDSIEGAFIDAVTSYPIVPSAYMGLSLLELNLSGHPIMLIFSFFIISFDKISSTMKNQIVLKIALNRSTTISLNDAELKIDKNKINKSTILKNTIKKNTLFKTIVYILTEELFIQIRFLVLIIISQLTDMGYYVMYTYSMILIFLIAKSELYKAYKISKKKLILKEINTLQK